MILVLSEDELADDKGGIEAEGYDNSKDLKMSS